MSESATVGLELWELRVRKGAIRGGRAQGSSCKQKGRQRQHRELEGHAMKTSDEGRRHEGRRHEDDNKSWKEDEQGLDPRNTRCLLFSCSKSRRPYIRSDHGRKD